MYGRQGHNLGYMVKYFKFSYDNNYNLSSG